MKSVKIQRKESILKEVLYEILSSMNDDRIVGLSVMDIVFSRDGSDAKIYLEKSFLTNEEQKETLKQLNKAKGFIKSQALKTTGWFKVPNMVFTFDDHFQKENRIEELFAKIAKEKK